MSIALLIYRVNPANVSFYMRHLIVYQTNKLWLMYISWDLVRHMTRLCQAYSWVAMTHDEVVLDIKIGCIGQEIAFNVKWRQFTKFSIFRVDVDLSICMLLLFDFACWNMQFTNSFDVFLYTNYAFHVNAFPVHSVVCIPNFYISTVGPFLLAIFS